MLIRYTGRQSSARRHLAEPPQGRKAARVSKLCWVRGGPFYFSLPSGPRIESAADCEVVAARTTALGEIVGAAL